MPAIASRTVEAGVHALQAREWRNTIGQTGMTPTAFAFLIPVLVVAIAAPFLCVFCIRRRRQPVAIPLRSTKKLALRREEARERLNAVTEVSNVTGEPQTFSNGTRKENAERVESRSVLERECAICLSTLHAPSPPEPAKLSDEMTTDEATKPPSLKDAAPSEPEAILRLHVCNHEFHAECLVSWFVLRKTSCPICRAEYYSKETMQQLDLEAQAQAQAQIEAAQATPATVEAQESALVIRNWTYFLHGRSSLGTPHANQPHQTTPQSWGQRLRSSGT